MPANAVPDDADKKLGVFPFVLGGMSFIPLIGLVFGLITVVWGLLTKRTGGKKLALIGAGGISFTIVLYGSLFYFGFVQRGGLYDSLRDKMAQNNLNSLVPVVEFYKLSHGEYPETLAVLKDSLPKGSIDSIFVFDPRALKFSEADRYFYYRKVDADHYYLRGVAADGKPFSPSALVPQIPASGSKLGLLTDAPPAQPLE